MSISEEQAAFYAILDDLLRTHEGQYVLFMSGEPRGFYEDYDAAYRAGLEQFGVDADFLVAKVARRKEPEPVSLALDAGVLFGKAT